MCLDTLLVLTAAKNQHKNVLGFGVVFFCNEWIDSLFLISDAGKFKLFGVGGTCHVVSWNNVRLVHCRLFSKPILLLKYRTNENKPFFSPV